MLRSLIGCFTTICLASSLWAAEVAPTTQPSPTAEILFLQIAKPLSPQLSRAAAAVPRRYGYNQNAAGIDMLVMFTVPDRTIVAANQDSLQIQTFIDDKYNDLSRRPEQRGVYSSGQSNITEDGRSCIFSISGDRAPAADASRILIRGTLNLRCTTTEKTSPREPLALRIGKTLKTGPVPLTIRSLSDGGGRGLQLDFVTNESIERIRSVRFFSTDGKELQARLSNRFDSAAQPGRTQSNMMFYLPEVVDEVLVEIVHVEKVEQLTLPVELQLDLGAIQIGTATSSSLPPKAEPRSSTQTPALPQAAIRSPNSNLAQSSINRTAASAAASWPPPRTAAAWPATRPAVVWPEKRPAIAWPTTRPAGADPAAPSRFPLYRDASVSVVGLGIHKAPPEFIRTKWGPQSELFFRPNGGTTLRLMLSVRDRFIIDVDTRNLRINRFADDTGADLSTALRRIDQSNYYYPASSASLSSDAQHGIFNVMLDESPSAGATRFLLSGDVTAQLGANLRTEEQKDFSIAVGSVIKAGPFSLTVKSLSGEQRIQEPTAKPPSLFMTLQSDKPLDAIRSIQFVDADDGAIYGNFQKNPATTSSAMSAGVYHANCMLFKALDRATVKVTYYEQVETVNIPIQVVAGVGL